MQTNNWKSVFKLPNTNELLLRPLFFLVAIFLSTGIAFPQIKEVTAKQKPSETITTKSNKKKSNEKKKSKFDFDLEFGMRTMYDDNILKYSDKYLEKFMNHEDEGRFHINTYDDIVLRPSFQVVVSNKLINNLKTEFDLNFNRSFYLNNNIKTWDYFSAGLRQYYSKRGSVKVSYSYIPDFYIRHYRDEDFTDVIGFIPESFKTMAFSKESYGIWAHQTFLKNTGVRLSLNYMRYFYNSFYTEYDSKDLSYEIKLYQPITDDFRIQIVYSFTKSNAKGFDDPGETYENSNDADATFVDNSYSTSINWKIPTVFGLKHNITLEGEFGERYFTTKHFLEVDPLHAGREDKNLSLSFSYDVSLTKSINATLFYNFLQRSTNSKAEINQEMVSAEKNYKQNQIGLSLVYQFKL